MKPYFISGIANMLASDPGRAWLRDTAGLLFMLAALIFFLIAL